MIGWFLYILLAVLCFPVSSLAQSSKAPSQVNFKWHNEFLVSVFGGYSYANFFGQNQVPTFTGMSYGGDLEYSVGTEGLSLAPFFAARVIDLKNSKAGSGVGESLSGNYYGVGLKIYSNSVYLLAGFGTGTLEDKVTGTTNESYTLKSSYVELGGGLFYRISKYTRITAGLDVAHFRFDTSDNPVTSRTDYIGYNLKLGLAFTLPSSGSK